LTIVGIEEVTTKGQLDADDNPEVLKVYGKAYYDAEVE